MKGRLSVSPGFWAAVLLLWIVDPQLIVPTAAAAGLHEGGHLLALWMLGRRVDGLRLTALGLELKLGGRELSYGRELAAALAGPVVSLLTAWLAARGGHFLFAGVSLALGLFNLLPVSPLDGGRAFSCLCALTLPPGICYGVIRWTAVVTAGLALGLSAAVFGRFGGPTLLFLAVWLAFRALGGEKDT